jgi:hypothetical protein
VPLTEVTREGREGFEIYVLALCLLAGAPLLFGAERPGSIQSLLPEQWQFVWSLFLVGGSALALAGIFWPHRATGLILEQVGMVPTAVASLTYALIVLITMGWTSIVPVAVVVGFGVACIHRPSTRFSEPSSRASSTSGS